MEKIITKNQVIHTIGTKLAEEFSSNGFKYIKSKNQLIRKNDDGFDKIVINTTSYYPISHQVLFVDFSKRINTVEDVINQFYDSRFKNPEFDKFTTTTYLDYKTLKKVYNSSFKKEDYRKCMICNDIKDLKEDGIILHTEKDIKNITSILSIFIRDEVLPFFEMSNDLEYIKCNKKKEILKNFNSNSWVQPLILMSSLVLMKLTKDSEFQKIKEEYMERMVIPENPDAHILETEVVKELIAYLEKIEI